MKTKVKTKYPTVSEDTRKKILATVSAASEPVTAGEVTLALCNKKESISLYTVSGTLRGLIADGHLICRPESNSERFMRADGSPTKGRTAMLYWPASADGHVPARTKRSVLAGVQTVAGVNLKKKARPAGASAVQTGNRIDRLENEVQELRKLVASLVKTIS